MKHARGVVPTLPEEISLKWTFDELTPYAATGDPTKATREKGKKMKEVLVNYLVDFIKKMDETDWKYG
jgi:creatinine amidohydrolase